ncbi:hypothetical protein [Botrimarina colliarenosi]|uniref:hypothetical protein n=1 Tax=Botrimarina colliarenosi TaxID=2528001 RepID=UPI0011B54816|nr:hypothetical protein [Botrimarina colliarenosi]
MLPGFVFALFLTATAHAEWPTPRPLDEGRLAVAGLRVVESRHATLVTDAASSAEIDNLPRLIDLAAPQWGERFGVEEDRLNTWRLRVYLIDEEAKFRALGLWPDKSGDFQHGLSLGYEVWVRQQATDYYRRHLLLHEATHSFMATLLGSCGPGWYMEGMAELCGTHAWDPATRKLRLAVIPASRDAAPDWGRIGLVRQDADAGKALSIEAVMRIDNRMVLSTESYAWVWALDGFLDHHPAYQERFRKAPGWVTSDEFDQSFRSVFAKDRRRLDQEWRLFTKTLDYGHDLKREAIDFRGGAPLAAGGSRRVKIAADRGWQSAGVAVKAGEPIHISATGRYVIGHEPDGAPWPCEPNGITLDYHAGRPLGELLATVDAGPGAFIEPTPIGLAADYTPPAAGTLYLRVNDAPDALAENEGEVTAVVTAR